MDGIDLSGQVGLVTGSGTGIGQGIAVGLARRGAVVVIADVEARRAEHTAKLIRDAGGEALPLTTDVMDTVQIEAAVRATDELYGRLDILVNNAGGVRGRRFLEQSERSWRRHIGINLTSMLATTWHSAHIMVREGRGGAIVNVASIEASRAAPMYAVYAACKAGMVNFTRAMAVELGEHGIRMNCIAPDQTRTPGLYGVRTGPVDPAQLRVRP
jgi:NAD(P)-dependent dehydrogenase (short-subunit alcohol dehydrogenase family)